MEIQPKILTTCVSDSFISNSLAPVGSRPDIHQVTNLLGVHKALSEKHFDVIIADYPSRVMTLKELMSVRDRVAPELPIILIIEDTDQKVPSEIHESGDDYCFKKDCVRLPGAVQRAVADSAIRRKNWEAGENLREQIKFNQIILDSFPHPIMLIKPNTFEVVASNVEAAKHGVTSGTHCYQVWEKQTTPCPWCQAPTLWVTGQAQRCEVEWKGRWWEAHWIPVDKSHYLHFLYDITERKRHELKLNELNVALSLAKDIDEIIVSETEEQSLFIRICHRIVENAAESAAWVALANSGEGLKPVAWAGKAIDFERCIGLTECAGAGVQRNTCTQQEFTSSISLPLKVEGIAIGTLNICSNQQGIFEAENLRVIQEIAFDLSLGIEKIRKREETRKQTKYIETLVDNLPIGIALNTVSDGKALYANRRFEEIYGWSRSDLPDVETFFEKVYPDAKIRSELKRRVLGDISSGDPERMRWDDLAITTSAGQKRYISAMNIPLLDQNLMISTVQDITDTKQAKQEIELRALLLNAVSDSIFLSEPDGKILWLNENAYRTRGYTRGELLGANVRKLRPSSESSEWDTQRKQILSAGELTYESVHQRKDGTTFPIEVHARALSHDGKSLILSVVRDITQRKHAEAENRLLSDKAEMSSRLAAVGEMAAGIAHEINNPLTGVIGFSELLLQEQNLPEQIKEDIAVINEGSQRVKDIVARMLTFARQSKPKKCALDITELIDNTIELRSYVLRTANILVVKDYAVELPWLTVDPGQMQQVFLNLIVNAEYSMKKAHDRGTLSIQARRLDGLVQITFKDDGLGMSREVVDKLFQPFFTTKQPGEGTGLGLALSFGIIKEHGGNIRVESEPGKGAAFTIELPVNTPLPESVIEDREELPHITADHAISVLVVDDEPYVRALIKASLNGPGFIVDECGSPQEALGKLEAASFDVLLLDIRMPGMSGMEFFERLSEKWPHLADKVLVITGDTSDLITREFLMTREIPFVTKPFTKAELVQKIEKLL